MKSAYELAMERLAKAEPAEKPLTVEKKARLAEIDTLFAQAGLTPPAAPVTPAPKPHGAAKSKAKPAAATPAKRKLHRNSKLYKARVAALQKAREARWAKFRAANTAMKNAEEALDKARIALGQCQRRMQ